MSLVGRRFVCDSTGSGSATWETVARSVRIDYGPGYRVYFALEGERLILLVLGGDKATQERDIIKAKDYWRDHQRRKDHGQA